MVKKLSGIFFLLLVFNSLNAQNDDVDALKKLNPQSPDSRYWRATSGSTYFVCIGTPVAMLVTGLIKNDAGLNQKSYDVLGALVTEVIISEAMKFSIDRKRPAESYPLEIFPYRNARGRSFPSGHTSLAFATAASVSLQYKKWYVVLPAYLYAGSVGYSRMYLGVHYPSDVIAGAAVGVGSAYLAHWLNHKLCKKKNLSPAIPL